MDYHKLLEEGKPLLFTESMPLLKKISKNKITFLCLIILAIIIVIATTLYLILTNHKFGNKILLARENTLNEEIIKLENKNDILEAKILLLKDEIKSLSKQKDQKKLSKISKYIANTEISGKGIEILLEDNDSDFAKEQDNSNIIHNTDLLKIVNFFWSQGATAIAINDERIVQNTHISCIGATILINQKRIISPFKISIIGKNIEKNMVENSSIMLSLKLRGIEFQITEKNNIIIPAGKYSSYKE